MYKMKKYHIKKIFLIFICFVCLLHFYLFLNGCKNKKNIEISSDINGESLDSENNDEKDYIEINLTTDSLNIYKSDKFVLVKDVIPNVIESIKYSGYENFIGKRIVGYESNVAILTKEAASALKNANNEFSKLGFGIIIYDAYRPVRAVLEFVEWTKDLEDVKKKNKFYPNVNKYDMIKNGYISEKSSHSRGSTVDLSLYNLKNGNYLDMGSNFDYFGDESYYDYKNLSIAERENRKILRDIMVKNGFKPIQKEWWHFTLIDEPYKDEYFDFPVSKKLDVVFDENKNKKINIEVIGDYIDNKENINYNYKLKKYKNFGNENKIEFSEKDIEFVNMELKEYLNEFKDVLNDDEINLILYNLPFLQSEIYFDIDYNDYTLDEMEKILNILLKIYNKEKEKLEIKYFNGEEYYYYPYGYNKSFLISNIKSLKNAIDRKEVANVNKDKLKIYQYNEDLLYGNYDILSVSDLKENSYYEVDVIKKENTMRELFTENDSYYDAKKLLKEGDIIDIYGRDIKEKDILYKHNIYKYIGSDNKLSRDKFIFNRNSVEVSSYDREELDYIFKIYKIRVLKNALFFNTSEDYNYDINGFDIYEYHGNVNIDNPLNNLQLENNLFMNKIENYIDKQKNIEDFLLTRNNYEDNYISQMIFDEKGYVTKLYKYVRE